MQKGYLKILIIGLLAVFWCTSAAFGQSTSNLILNGDLESYEPGFWVKYNGALSGAAMTWDSGEKYEGERSYKIVKSGATTAAVGWTSENNTDLYWNNAGANLTYNISYYAKTSGVNTSPGSDDEKIYVEVIITQGGTEYPIIKEVDQAAASSDWTKYETVLVIGAGDEPSSIVARVLMGKDATGTVWFDKVNVGTDPWTMGIFNGNAETPVGWMQWYSTGDTGYASLVTDQAHSGTYSAKLVETDANADEIVFYSIPATVKPNTWYKFGCWVKTENINTDPAYFESGITPDRDNNRLGFTFFFHNNDPLTTGWDLSGGDQFVYIAQTDSTTDWTYVTWMQKSPSDASGASMRARFTSFCTGTVWFDDFYMEEVSKGDNILVNAGLETYEPGFWNKTGSGATISWADDEKYGGERSYKIERTTAVAGTNLITNGDLETYTPAFWSTFGSDATMTWASDEKYDGERSYKIVKAAASSASAGWVSENNTDLYWNNAGADKTYNISFYAKTSDVNTSPATDDAKIYLQVTITQDGTDYTATKAVDQTAAASDWALYEEVLVIGAGSEPSSVVAKIVMGKDATGTVWFDKVKAGTDPWTMGMFNGDAETPTGWMQWYSTGDTGYASLVSDQAHSGTYSAKLVETDANADEIVFYSIPAAVKPNTWYKFGCWVKTENINTDPTYFESNITPDRDNNRLGFTFFFHKSDPLTTGWDLSGGDQFVYINQTDSTSDWSFVTWMQKSPSDASGASMRARFTSFPTGTVWFDDFSMEEVVLGTNIINNSSLETYEPGHWSKLNSAEGSMAWDTAEKYSGERSYKVSKSAASTSATGWLSDNNADLFWNNAGADLTYNISYYAKATGLPSSPASNDEKAYIEVTITQDGTDYTKAVAVSPDSTGWAKYEDVLVIGPGSDPGSVVIKAIMGKDATGTVWFDDINVGTDPWKMGVFNGNAETPVGWMQWYSTGDTGYASIVNDQAHSGTYSAKLVENDDNADEIVFYSEPAACEPNTWYRVSGFVKTEMVNTDSKFLPTGITPDRDNNRLGFCFFYHKSPLETAWDLDGGDLYFYVDQRDSTKEWTEFWVLSKSPSEASGISMRARFTSFPKGTVWFDDFSVEKVSAATAGKVLAASSAAGWVSTNNAKLYWNGAAADLTYNISYYAKTSGLPSTPASNDEKAYVEVTITQDGTDYTKAVAVSPDSTGWAKYEDVLVIGPGSDPSSVVVKALMGKDASGTVWFDNVNVGTDPWKMGLFNGDAETPVGWMQWYSTGDTGYASVVSDYAHGGTYSAKLIELDDNADEIVFYSEPVECKPESWYRLSGWVKTDMTNKDTKFLPTGITPDRDNGRIGFCFFYHKTPLSTSWDLSGGDQYFYIDQRDTTSDWTEYWALSKSPVDAGGVSMRARYTSFPKGYSWFDDFAIEKVEVLVTDIQEITNHDNPSAPREYRLNQNYPNPFNPETIIEYEVLKPGKVKIEVFNITGQKVKTLVNKELSPGKYYIKWHGVNDSGTNVSSGTYIYSMKTENARLTKKMTIIR